MKDRRTKSADGQQDSGPRYEPNAVHILRRLVSNKTWRGTNQCLPRVWQAQMCHCCATFSHHCHLLESVLKLSQDLM